MINDQFIKTLFGLFNNDPEPNIINWRYNGSVIQIRYEDADGMIMIGEINFSESYAAKNDNDNFEKCDF